MSTYDPRIVAQVLDDLQSQMARWSSIASEILATATDIQRHAKEAVDRAIHKSAIIFDRAKDDEESVQKAISSVAVATEKSETATTTARQTLKKSQLVLEGAEDTLQKWQIELEKALAWLARAEARLAKAIQQLERALSALSSAEWKLSSAESRYRACMNDKNRRNCSNAAVAVSRARSEVASARQWVAVAQQEVAVAKEEVEQAKARVMCCQEAVAFSTEAVSLAQESVLSATQAVNSAERSFEFAHAAEKLVQTAQREMLAEIEVAENMMSGTRIAQEFTNNAAFHLRAADSAEDSAQIYSTSVQKELEYRTHQLYELNRSTISGAHVSSHTSSTSSHKPSPNSSNFTDKAGRPIALRSWESGNQVFVRAYDTNQVLVPDMVDTGQAGYANATLEKSFNGQTRVRLNDIVTSSKYRGSGIGGQMLGKVEDFARQHGAYEIYGSIDSENAHTFWASQSSKGWVIVPQGVYGELHYSLKNE